MMKSHCQKPADNPNPEDLSLCIFRPFAMLTMSSYEFDNSVDWRRLFRENVWLNFFLTLYVTYQNQLKHAWRACGKSGKIIDRHTVQSVTEKHFSACGRPVIHGQHFWEFTYTKESSQTWFGFSVNKPQKLNGISFVLEKRFLSGMNRLLVHSTKWVYHWKRKLDLGCRNTLSWKNYRIQSW